MNIANSQTITISGHISDEQGNNLFAVNVYLLKENTVGTVSDIEGNFSLKIANPNLIKIEYLVSSFISHKQLKMAFDSINYMRPIHIVMTEKTQALNELVVEGRKSISREFSIKEMDKLKIYLSPLASARSFKSNCHVAIVYKHKRSHQGIIFNEMFMIHDHLTASDIKEEIKD